MTPSRRRAKASRSISEVRVPERTCVGCRQRRSQAALVRCVLTADGRAVVDRSGAGRGAWLCIPAQDCFELARRRKAFERAWRRPVGPDALAELGRQLGPQAERESSELRASELGSSGPADEVRDDEKG